MLVIRARSAVRSLIQTPSHSWDALWTNDLNWSWITVLGRTKTIKMDVSRLLRHSYAFLVHCQLVQDYFYWTDCLFCSSMMNNLSHVYQTDRCGDFTFINFFLTFHVHANLKSLRNLFTATAGHWFWLHVHSSSYNNSLQDATVKRPLGVEQDFFIQDLSQKLMKT